MTRVVRIPSWTRISILAAAAAISVVDRRASGQETSRVSVGSAGRQGDDRSETPSISADGRYVAFTSQALNLVPGDTNGGTDVFVHDRTTGVTSLVSVSTAGFQGSDSSYAPSISADGRFVAFISAATNLVPGDTNLLTDDVFVHDRANGVTSRVSVNSAGVQGNDTCLSLSISADGRYVAFGSGASNFAPGDTNEASDVFVHDRTTGATSLVSADLAGVPGNDGSYEQPSISADGRFVAFRSRASNLVLGDGSHVDDVFVRDRETETTTRVSVDSAGGEGNAMSASASISADGRFVAFESGASNLVPGDTNMHFDVFVHDRVSGITLRVSTDSGGTQANGASREPSVSPNGRFVAFWSDASNLVPGDTNGTSDVFVHDRLTGVTSRASVDSAGVQGNSRSAHRPSISADGRIVAFPSDASNLVPGDTNGVRDVFVHVRALCRDGTVNAGLGVLADVLRIDGSVGDADRIVTVPVFAPVSISLDASPSGPGGPGLPLAHYALWVWPASPSNSVVASAGGRVLGCTVNPSPLRPLDGPQPFRCLLGAGMPEAIARSVPTLAAPDRAPWIVTRGTGFSRSWIFTLQGILEDDGAANAAGFSVTNAVILRVE
jgi:Tol biopolymer transport system component